MLFCVPDGFAHASLRMDARAKLHPRENRLRGDNDYDYLPGHSLRIRPSLTLTLGDNLFSYLRVWGLHPPDFRRIGRDPTT